MTLSKTLALLTLALTFGCSSPLESWSGEMECNGEDTDIEIHFDDEEREPQGFFGFEQGDDFGYFPIEDLDRDGEDIEFNIENFDGPLEAEFERDGDTLEGDVENRVFDPDAEDENGFLGAIVTIKCDAELELDN